MSQATSQLLSTEEIQTLINKGKDLVARVELNQLKTEVDQLQTKTVQPGFWDTADAQDIMQQLALHKDRLNQYQQLQSLIQDAASYLELKQTESDESIGQLNNEFSPTLKKLQALIADLQTELYLSGKFDKNHAILSIHPGQGGTEAMDWAEMLERMYSRYFERKNWPYQFLSEIKGEEAGIKEVSFEIRAPYAYGYLKNERGTHRLVRLSPFNANNLRQTSFALIEVMPIIEKDEEIDLKNEDLSWHFTRAGGPGGQSVNKTNSAVELTHEPTGITVKARQSRSQIENKQTALKMLKAQLAQKIEQQIEEKLAKEKGAHTQASWGTQIRNYVLHPYQLVKDTRTQVETNDTQAVLDGDLDQFIKEEIKLS